jgi:hypothetical protein
VIPGRAAAILLFAAPLLAWPAEGEFRFDASEFEKKPFEFGGYLEPKAESLRMRPESVLYRLTLDGEPPRDSQQRTTGTVEFGGKWSAGAWSADALLHGASVRGPDGTTSQGRLYEGGVGWSPNEGLALDAGKRAKRWGKGYAWNPVGFIEREKDPNDPQLSREGYVMAGADWVKSFEGPLGAVGLTAVVVPVRGDINEDFGAPDHANPAAKLYLLYQDTDIDFLWQGKGSRPAKVGADFSRNVGTNLEVHGEWARAFDAPRTVVDADGNVRRYQEDADRWLLGLRYLTESDVTVIAEYYRNGPGYDEQELADFYSFVDGALSAGAPPSQVARASALARSPYVRPNPGRDYLYLRASAKEPFDLLYFTPSVTLIANVGDRSRQVTAEALYTGFTNVEIRARAIATIGDPYTDFGEKPAKARFEIYARIFF